ncbi:hypothetical protein Tco_1504963, partial [Tanacetum coccineum]
KNRFETYVKAKDLDLWHIILNGDFPPVAKNEVTQVLEVVPFEEQSDDLKKKLAKNNEAKMVLYNALPKKEYERIFMCKTAKDIWKSLLITHQGNSQVKDNKIDLLVQQYEQFTILEEESIDSGFARFNTIITSLKALDEGFSSKNYVRKFLRALHPKWRAKVTAIEESKDLSSLALDELIGNLKVHEVVMEKDSKIYRGKKERVKSIALKAKKESSDDETSFDILKQCDEEYAMAVRNFKKFFRRKGKFVGNPREERMFIQTKGSDSLYPRGLGRIHHGIGHGSTMPGGSVFDNDRVHRSRQIDDDLRESYRTLEKRLFHEERIVTPSFITENNMLLSFQAIGLEPFLTLNGPICPRFVVEFYHSLEVKRNEEDTPYIEFKLGQFTFKLTLSRLSRILQTPHTLETFYSSEWSLNSLDDHPNRKFFGPKHDLVKKAITVPRTTRAQLLRDPNTL